MLNITAKQALLTVVKAEKAPAAPAYQKFSIRLQAIGYFDTVERTRSCNQAQRVAHNVKVVATHPGSGPATITLVYDFKF
ncbi:hypothetical protein [Pseudomonas ogarae]